MKQSEKPAQDWTPEEVNADLELEVRYLRGE